MGLDEEGFAVSLDGSSGKPGALEKLSSAPCFVQRELS